MNKLAAWAGKVSGSRYPTSGRGKRSGGTTFSSKEALATYSRAHPKADMSKHTVAASAPKAGQVLPYGPTASGAKLPHRPPPAGPVQTVAYGPTASAAQLPAGGPKPKPTTTEKAYSMSDKAKASGTPAAHDAAEKAHLAAAKTATTNHVRDEHMRSANQHFDASTAARAAPAAAPAAPTRMATALKASKHAEAENTHAAHTAAADAHRTAAAGTTSSKERAGHQQAVVQHEQRARDATRRETSSRIQAAAAAANRPAPTAASIAKGSQGQVHVDAVRRDLAAGVHPNTVMQRHVGNVPGPQIQAEARAHQARQAAAAAPAAQPLTTQAAALRGAPAPQATAGAKAMSERANATNTVGAHRAAAVAHGAARESHALAGNTAEAAHHASQQALHTDKYRAPRTPRGARPERAAPAAAPTAPLPAAGSYEHSRREEVAKSAAQGGEREASRGADAMRAGKAGLAANHYMKAATNHLALHPTHGSLESQITKAESALSSAAAALDRVTDRASANRLDASMREAKGVVASMKKFAAMKPEQREAEVIKRNQNSRMR